METTTKKNTAKKYNSETKKDSFIEKIIENLDLVSAKDWEFYSDLSAIYPTNLFSKKRYNGFNVISLYLDTMVKNFKSSKYATFNSISKAGGKLKKGSKGCVIEFFSYIFKDKETGKIISDEQMKFISLEQRKNLLKIACLKNYTVFNSELIENIEDINLNYSDDEPNEVNIFEIENCELFISKIIENGFLKLKFGLDEVAYYSPSLDYVKLPKREFFLSTPKYYSTLFHEIIHWTGHPKRLNRELKGSQDRQSYSFEELIAEMGAMLCSLQFGILDEFINSVRYLKSWSDANTEDRNTLIRNAFVESKRAKKYLESL